MSKLYISKLRLRRPNTVDVRSIQLRTPHITVENFLGRNDGRTKSDEAPTVPPRCKYLVSTPNFLSELNFGYGFK